MIDPRLQGLTGASADVILNAVAAEAAAATPDVLDDRGKLMIAALIAVAREMLASSAAIAASLKSIAVSQEVVAAEAKLSMDMLKSEVEPTNQTDAADWRDETL